MNRIQPWPTEPPDFDAARYHTPVYTCPKCSADLDRGNYITVIHIRDTADKDQVRGWICKNCNHEIPNRDYRENL